MSFFDEVELTPLPEDLAGGAPFKMTKLYVGPTIQSKFGESTAVMVEVNGESTYSVFGQGVLRQAREITPDALPAFVRLERKPTKTGNAIKIFVDGNKEIDKIDKIFADGNKKIDSVNGAVTDDDDIPF